ncbi:hypothetical protein NQ318_008297, partial [Aromia moschata]
DPTPRWSALRGSQELRPYNSLPRGQDITSYPSLVQHQSNARLQNLSGEACSSPAARRRSPTRRTHSEDVYTERSCSPFRADGREGEEKEGQGRRGAGEHCEEAGARQSPHAAGGEQAGQREDGVAEEEVVQGGESLAADATRKSDKAINIEKRVSFDKTVANKVTTEKSVSVLRTQSLNDGKTKERRLGPIASRSLPEDHTDNCEEAGATLAEVYTIE